MTIKNRDTDSLQSSSINAVRQSGLRLVTSKGGEVHEPEGLIDDQATTCVVLKSALFDKSRVATSVLTHLFKNPGEGERIEFIHRCPSPRRSQ